MTDPVRAHLMIGPLASGKTTVAWRLVERLQARGVQARRLAITEEYEKPVQRYEEPDVLQYFLILERIDDDVPRHLYSRVARKLEMVVDSTPVTRELRLRFLQGMPLPRRCTGSAGGCAPPRPPAWNGTTPGCTGIDGQATCWRL